MGTGGSGTGSCQFTPFIAARTARPRPTMFGFGRAGPRHSLLLFLSWVSFLVGAALRPRTVRKVGTVGSPTVLYPARRKLEKTAFEKGEEEELFHPNRRNSPFSAHNSAL